MSQCNAIIEGVGNRHCELVWYTGSMFASDRLIFEKSTDWALVGAG